MKKITWIIILLATIFSTQSMAQNYSGKWQDETGSTMELDRNGYCKIDNVNGTYYGTWMMSNGQVVLDIFTETEPYTFGPEVFDEMTRVGTASISEDEVAPYTDNGGGGISLSAEWKVDPTRVNKKYVGTWKFDDGVRCDLAPWGGFKIVSAQQEVSHGLYEIDGNTLRLQFLFTTEPTDIAISDLLEGTKVGGSKLTPEAFKQAELQLFNRLSRSQQQANQMSLNMMQQMHETTMDLIWNLSGRDWEYVDDPYRY